VTDIACLPFGTSSEADQQGAVILSDDGTVRIDPSPIMRDALAQQESDALAVAGRHGKSLGVLFFLLGALAIAGDWYAGRHSGKIAGRLLWPHDVRNITIERDPEGRVALERNNKRWIGGRCSNEDFRAFQALAEEMKQR
jgi:hypothetical protein